MIIKQWKFRNGLRCVLIFEIFAPFFREKYEKLEKLNKNWNSSPSLSKSPPSIDSTKIEFTPARLLKFFYLDRIRISKIWMSWFSVTDEFSLAFNNVCLMLALLNNNGLFSLTCSKTLHCNPELKIKFLLWKVRTTILFIVITAIVSWRLKWRLIFDERKDWYWITQPSYHKLDKIENFKQ